jgi:glutaredoxin
MPRRGHLVIAITIYSRPGCHLCDEMKALVYRVAAATARIEDVDISTDPELESRFGLEIPVLMIGGKKVAKYRISEEALKKLLADRSSAQAG